jgi:hypothetical protein
MQSGEDHLVAESILFREFFGFKIVTSFVIPAL